MERVLFQEIATPADLHEHHKWARRVGAFYGILFLGGISFVLVHHHYQPTNHVKPAVTSVAAINHLHAEITGKYRPIYRPPKSRGKETGV